MRTASSAGGSIFRYVAAGPEAADFRAGLVSRRETDTTIGTTGPEWPRRPGKTAVPRGCAHNRQSLGCSSSDGPSITASGRNGTSDRPPTGPSEEGGLEELVRVLLPSSQLPLQIGDLLFGVRDLLFGVRDLFIGVRDLLFVFGNLTFAFRHFTAEFFVLAQQPLILPIQLFTAELVGVPMAIRHYLWLPCPASRSRTHPPYGNRSRAICPEKSTGVPELLPLPFLGRSAVFHVAAWMSALRSRSAGTRRATTLSR